MGTLRPASTTTCRVNSTSVTRNFGEPSTKSQNREKRLAMKGNSKDRKRSTNVAIGTRSAEETVTGDTTAARARPTAAKDTASAGTGTAAVVQTTITVVIRKEAEIIVMEEEKKNPAIGIENVLSTGVRKTTAPVAVSEGNPQTKKTRARRKTNEEKKSTKR